MKKALPELDSAVSRVFGLSFEAVKWELLKAAIELGVFDHLVEPATSAELAARLSTHPGNTKFMLNALVALGCLSKQDGQFQNAPLADAYLVGGKDTFLGDFLLFADGWNQPLMGGGLKELVKNGPPPPRSVQDETLWETGARAGLNFNRCGRAQRVAEYVAALPEFASFRRMLDMGAGSGVIGIAVAAAHPSLECVLLDQRAVCRVADEVIAEYGMEARVSTLPGNYMTDPIGAGYDFIMANYTLNFYKDRLDQVFNKVYEALEPGGVFIVCSDGLSREKTAPAASVISWLSTSLMGADMSFERGVIADAMLRAGFVSAQSQMFDDFDLAAHGPVDVIVGRKNGADR